MAKSPDPAASYMTATLKRLLVEIRSSFWFFPGTLILAALVFAWASVEIDLGIGYEIDREAKSWNIFIGPDGARSLLNTIAGSMITVASLVFSMTLIALTMAASNLGPRIIHHFMRDRVTQISLGVFLATFVYAITSLLTVREGGGRDFVPYVALITSVVLSILSFGWLIFFVNRVAHQLQADNVVAFVAADLEDAIASVLESGGRDPDPDDEDSEPPDAGSAKAVPLPAPATGYIQTIDVDSIVETAAAFDGKVQISRRAGSFVVADEHIGLIIPSDAVDEEEVEAIQWALGIGRQRTIGQDLEFAILQMVDVAIRALSPGINDQNTAVTTVDRLTGALATALKTGLPRHVILDDGGQPRLWLEPLSYRRLICASFDQIRQSARGNVTVSDRLLRGLTTLARFTRTDAQRNALQDQADSIVEGAREIVPDRRDLELIEQRHEDFLTALKENADENQHEKQDS